MFRRLFTLMTVFELLTVISGRSINYMFPIMSANSETASVESQGLLFALPSLCVCILGFFIGSLVDNFSKIPVLVVTNIIRILVLGAMVVYYMRCGEIPLLYLNVVACIMAICALTHQTAVTGLTTKIFDIKRYVLVNSMLNIVNAVGKLCGATIAGLLLYILWARDIVLALIMVYALSIVVLFMFPRHIEQPIASDKRRKVMRLSHVIEGIRLVCTSRILRPGMLALTHYYCFSAVLKALSVYYYVRIINLSPGLVTCLLVAPSIGNIVGSTIISRLPNNFPIGTFFSSFFVGIAAAELVTIKVAGLEESMTQMIVMCIAQLVSGICFSMTQVTYGTVCQMFVPSDKISRVFASTRCLFMLSEAAGGIFGGMLITNQNMQDSLVFASFTLGAAIFWIHTKSSLPAVRLFK